MKYKIKCFNNKEALKLYKMLVKFKQKEYIGYGEISVNKKIVIFNIQEK